MTGITNAVDRVLEALSPALAAELEHVVQETREAVEREFQGRLQTTASEVEAAASAAQAEREKAVQEAKEETRRLVTTELEQQFNSKLEAATNQLKNEAKEEHAKVEALNQSKTEWTAERAKLQEELERWRTFADSQRQLSEASSQPEILLRFLKLTQPFAESLAVYVTKADGLALWMKRGKGAYPEIVSQQTRDPESYFRTIAVRGKTIGAVCATASFKKDALDFLAGSLEQAIELFGSKLRTPASKPASETA